MKKTSILETLGNIAFNFLMGLFVALLLGSSATLAVATGLSFIAIGIVLAETHAMPKGVAFAGLLKEIWISQLMERFYPAYSWMLRSQDMSAFVENNTINLADIGADPNVLVDNSSYPVAVAERTDTALALVLKTLDTENTVVRNSTKVQLAYNLLESVIKSHRSALMQKCSALAAWNYGGVTDTALTPVASLGNGSIIDALYDQQARYNAVNAPLEGRILVLDPGHQSKLLKEDKALYKQFADPASGQVFKLAGFDVYTGTQNPTFATVGGVVTKKTFGAAAAGGDLKSSITYLESEVMRADGTVTMFSLLNEPLSRGDIVGFQKRFIALSIRNKFNGAITD